MTILHDYDITSFTTFGIKAKARYFAEYSSVKELEDIMRTPEYQQSEVLHIGGGSNLLFVNDFDGFVLHSKITGKTIYRKDSDTAFVIAGAGENWDEFVAFCVDNSLSGLENLSHIPGEVGASAVQNVGAYGVEAADFIHSVECYDRLSHKIVTLKPQECNYSYRDSIFKHEAKRRYFVLRVSFRLKPGEEAQNLSYGPLRSLEERLGHKPSISEVRDEVVAVRHSKLPEPTDVGSAGSFFTNPIVHKEFYKDIVLRRNPETPCYELDDNRVKLPAGWLVDHAGMKGAREGGAVVWQNQALVIANDNNASSHDVVRLAERVKEAVFNKYGVVLNPEVNYIGAKMKATILGSGTSKGVPEVACSCEVCRSTDSRDKRLRASALISVKGKKILIDVSPDFRYQALRENITDIDAVLLTHSHYDHVGGIDDLRPFCAHRNLQIYLRKDVESDLRRRLDYCFRVHPYPGVPTFTLHEVGDDAFYIDDVKIVPIKVMHAALPIVGYRIGKFAYITDAKSIAEKEIEKLKGVDTLIVNALRQRPHFSHFNIEEALDCIAKINPRKAYLTHMCHEIGLHRNEKQLNLPENVHLAFDGLTIEI